MVQELEKFREYVREKGLNQSPKREWVLEAFLKSKTHLSAQELHRIVEKKHSDVGYTTVYRTLKMIVECGLAHVVDFNDGVKRYEPCVDKDTHAHFICQKCGKDYEVFDKRIGRLILGLAKENEFSVDTVRYEIFGTCRGCAPLVV
ncbi:MAG: transcriptional repressor [Candidatus Omnitrophica bacterium]|nr:transcriptional repressor [Candidatus Omnitrophota bacterium]